MFDFLNVVILSLFTLISNGDDVTGYWKTIDDETNEAKAIVHIYKEDGKLQGKIVKLLSSPNDSKCTACKGDLHNENIQGMQILYDLESRDQQKWEDGKILDPKKGKTYTCKLWLDEEKQNILNVRGYWGFIYRTQTWHRTTQP